MCFVFIKVQVCLIKRHCPSDTDSTFVSANVYLFECGVSVNRFLDCRYCTKKVNGVIFVFSFMLVLLYTHLQVLPSFHQRIRLGLSNPSDWCDAKLKTICQDMEKILKTPDTKHCFNVKHKTFMNNLLHWLVLCLILKCLHQWKLDLNTQTSKIKIKTQPVQPVQRALLS